jgi:hypothetical protein
MCGMPRICSVYKEIGADGKRGWSSELDLIIHCQLEKANNTRIFQKTTSLFKRSGRQLILFKDIDEE